jgi:hypothetical protein
MGSTSPRERAAIAEVFRLSGADEVIKPPRQCVELPTGTLRLTTAIMPLVRMAVKSPEKPVSGFASLISAASHRPRRPIVRRFFRK